MAIASTALACNASIATRCKNYMFKIHEIFVHVNRSSDDRAISYVLPVLWMTSCLLMTDMWPMAKIDKMAYIQSDSPEGNTDVSFVV